MQKCSPHALKLGLQQIRPPCKHRPQLRLDTSVRPPLVSHFAITHPGWLGCGQTAHKVDLMVAHDEADIGRAEQQVQTLGRMRPDGDRISGVKDSIDPLCPNGGKRRLQSRKVSMDISNDGNSHRVRFSRVHGHGQLQWRYYARETLFCQAERLDHVRLPQRRRRGEGQRREQPSQPLEEHRCAQRPAGALSLLR